MSLFPPSSDATSTPAAGAPEKKQRRRDPVPNDVYVRDDEHRRVVSVGEYFRGMGDAAKKIRRVCYSSGGDNNRWCNMRTFRSWMSKSKLTHDGGVK